MKTAVEERNNKKYQTCSAPTVLIGLHLKICIINFGMNELDFFLEDKESVRCHRVRVSQIPNHGLTLRI